jgi:hypothetical protein
MWVKINPHVIEIALYEQQAFILEVKVIEGMVNPFYADIHFRTLFSVQIVKW